jgi:uncharacterized membrane protein
MGSMGGASAQAPARVGSGVDRNTTAGGGPSPGEAQAVKRTSNRDRFSFIDQFRGLIGIMMALGHSSSAFNGAWKSLDMFDPLFSNWGQFALRYMGYLCAPGFLMMNGAVSWYSYTRRRANGATVWEAKWHLIKRGLFLMAMQFVWVNQTWSGFAKLYFWHFGIIATIGMSMCLLALLLDTSWKVRLAIGLGVFVIHPFLLEIPYDYKIVWQRVIMQTFVDAGDFTRGDWNKYPVLPWFALGCMGSVMAAGWFGGWKTPKRRILMSWGIGLAAIGVAIVVRMLRGWGNSTDFYQFGHISFFLDSKYPPNLFHNLFFFGTVSFMVGLMHLVGLFAMPAVRWLGTIGRVPFFFYCLHIPLLFIVSYRFGVYTRQGGVAASLIGWVCLLVVMYPLAWWFGRLKQRNKFWLIQMI